MAFEFYKVFGFEGPKLCIDSKQLEKRFYDLSFQFHPDRNLDSPLKANEQSADLNKAYGILKDRWSRAEYVVREMGLQFGKQIPTALAELYFKLQDESDRPGFVALLSELETRKADREKKLSLLEKKFDALSEEVVRQPLLSEIRDLLSEETYSASMERDLRARLTEHSCGTMA